jgi:hypothetical protein
MSTRSAIIIEEESGKSLGIYCHNSGYVAHHKPILLECYATEGLARQLVELGSISVLGPAIGTKCDFYDQQDGQCVAYSRDRGDTGEFVEILKGKNWLKVAEQIGHDGHVYVFRVATQSWWYEGEATGAVDGQPRGRGKFVPLAEVECGPAQTSPRRRKSLADASRTARLPRANDDA